jgi:anti-sigma regulatory factor (Ser/Thr protein kinase)
MANMQKIVLKNNISEIERLNNLLESFGKDNDIPQKTIFSINLALEEMISNVIYYGYKDFEEHLITVLLSYRDDEINITIEDDGSEFDPTKVSEPNKDLPVEERQIGGLGIHLARTLIDEMKYKRENKKNILMLRKVIPSLC